MEKQNINTYSATLQFSRPPQGLARDCADWEGRDSYESEEHARKSLIEHLGDKGYKDPQGVVGEYVIIELAKEQ